MGCFCWGFFVFLGGGGVFGWLGFNRVLRASSHLRSPSRTPEEAGWCKPVEQIFDPTTDVHTCTHTLTHSRRSDSSLFTPVGPSAWICICNNILCLSSCLWLGRHDARMNEMKWEPANNSRTVVNGLTLTLYTASVLYCQGFSSSFWQAAWCVEWVGLSYFCENNLSGNVAKPELTNIAAPVHLGSLGCYETKTFSAWWKCICNPGTILYQ